MQKLDDFNDINNMGNRRVLFISGAGLSEPSGIKTFRHSSTALWDEYDVNEVCNIATFQQNYQLVHDFYNGRRSELESVDPNEMHKFIADIEKKYGNNAMHLTTNVDDLSTRCGGNPYYVHGKLTEMVSPYDYKDFTVHDIGYSKFVPEDGIISKPNVTFFGESFRYDIDNPRIYKPLYDDLDHTMSLLNGNDLVIVIGSSFHVVAFDVMINNRHFKPVSVNINPRKSDYDSEFTHNFYTSCDSTELIDTLRNMIYDHMEMESEPL